MYIVYINITANKQCRLELCNNFRPFRQHKKLDLLLLQTKLYTHFSYIQNSETKRLDIFDYMLLILVIKN